MGVIPETVMTSQHGWTWMVTVQANLWPFGGLLFCLCPGLTCAYGFTRRPWQGHSMLCPGQLRSREFALRATLVQQTLGACSISVHAYLPGTGEYRHIRVHVRAGSARYVPY